MRLEPDSARREIISDNDTMLNTQVLKKYKIEENKINDEVSYTITDEVSYTIFIIPKDGKVDIIPKNKWSRGKKS